METKHAVVIDGNGYKAEFVLVDIMADAEEIPQFYTMQEDERLIYDDIEIALSMIKPRWNGELWEETAAPEEIKALTPNPEIIQDTVSELEIAFAEYVIGTEIRLTELEEKINA